MHILVQNIYIHILPGRHVRVAMGTNLTRSLKASHGIALCGTLLNVCDMDIVQEYKGIIT